MEFGNGKIVSSHTLQAMWVLSLLGLNLNHVSKRGPSVPYRLILCDDRDSNCAISKEVIMEFHARIFESKIWRHKSCLIPRPFVRELHVHIMSLPCKTVDCSIYHYCKICVASIMYSNTHFARNIDGLKQNGRNSGAFAFLSFLFH